jgi:hypothetical protein
MNLHLDGWRLAFQLMPDSRDCGISSDLEVARSWQELLGGNSMPPLTTQPTSSPQAPTVEQDETPPLAGGTTENVAVGAEPAPPPSTKLPAGSSADDASPVVLLKYGIPPEVTLDTVSGNAPLPAVLVMLNVDPDTEQVSPLTQFRTKNRLNVPMVTPAL